MAQKLTLWAPRARPTLCRCSLLSPFSTVLATGNTLQLDWKPVTRDCFFYAAAIAGIVGTFAGGRVDWWEGLIYVLFYGEFIF